MQYIKLSNNRRCCTACLRKNTGLQFGDLNVTLARTNTFQCYDLIMEQDINVAMRKGFFQQIRILAHLGCDVNARDTFGRTPLINCALVEDDQWSVGLARTLLQHGAEPAAKDFHLGMSVMHFACVLGQLDLVNFLLKSAPDIDLCGRDKRGNTPLHYAAATGNQHVLSAVLNACSRYQTKVFDAKNKAGCTPLELAFTNEHLECCNLLRAAQTSLVRQRTEIITETTTPVDLVAAQSAATSRRVSELTSASLSTSQYSHVSTSQASAADGHHNEFLQQEDSQSPSIAGHKGDEVIDDVKIGTPMIPENCRQIAIDYHPQFCASSMTATSARQRRTESRRLVNRTVADMVDDQLRSTRSLRPNVAIRASRRMMIETTAPSGRPASAPFRGTASPTTNQQPHQDDIIPAEVLQTRRLRSALASDPRNKPFGNILSTPAVEFFAATDHRSNNPTAGTVSNMAKSSDNSANWRLKVTRLYADYDYHFTTSYRPAAVPPPVLRRTSETDSNGAENDGVRRPSNGDGQRSLRAGSGRRTSVVKFNGTGNTFETTSGGRKTSLISSNASSTATSSHKLKKAISTLGLDTADSTAVSNNSSLRPKSGKVLSAAVSAVLQKKGRRAPAVETSESSPRQLRGSHWPIETPS